VVELCAVGQGPLEQALARLELRTAWNEVVTEVAFSAQDKHAVAPVVFTNVPVSQTLQPDAAEALE